MILRVLPRKKSCADAGTRRLKSAISGASIAATSKPITYLCTTHFISLALVGLVPAHLSHKRLVVGTSLEVPGLDKSGLDKSDGEVHCPLAARRPACRNANEDWERDIHDPGCFCRRRLSSRPAAAA